MYFEQGLAEYDTIIEQTHRPDDRVQKMSPGISPGAVKPSSEQRAWFAVLIVGGRFYQADTCQ